MSERVTIKSIAKDLGISHMTVSRALSNHPNVHAETRKLVLERAAALGYIKSAAATAMRGDGTKIVGLLLPNIVNEFYARFANALAKASEERGYHLIIHLTSDEIALEQRSIQRLLEVQAMAAILVPAPGTPSSQSPRQLGDMTIIQLIRQRKWSVPTGSILVDDSPAIRDAVIHLARSGHTAIGYIGGDAALSSGRGRLSAFKSGLRASELAEIPALIKTGAPSFAMGQDCARDLLDEGQATAIVCGGFEISNGALTTMLERESSTSNRIAFVGYGDPSFYTWIDGGVSTVQIPVESLAAQAADMLSESSASQGSFAYPARLIIRNEAGAINNGNALV